MDSLCACEKQEIFLQETFTNFVRSTLDVEVDPSKVLSWSLFQCECSDDCSFCGKLVSVDEDASVEV